LKYEITVSVNGTGLEKVENITINDSLLGVVQWPGIDLNAGESRSWTIDAATTAPTATIVPAKSATLLSSAAR